MFESRLHLHFLLLILLCCVSPSSFYTFKYDDSIYVACHPNQTQALTEFMNEFDSNHCNLTDPYNGVWCDNSTGVVTMLRLRDCLSGNLKPNSSLFRLHHLRHLVLDQNNFISSSLPSEFGNLNRSLTLLKLSNNNLTGPIPQCLSQSLTFVNLRKNNLEGSIPDTFYMGASLRSLDVGHNLLAGKLPRSLQNCSSLEFLVVDHNKIKDKFPFWLKALPNLQVLILSSNKFYGSISPPDQGPLGFPELQIFEISDNKFSGSLPPKYFVNWKASTFTMNEDGDIYMQHGEFIHGEFSAAIMEAIDMRYKGLSMEQKNVLTSYATIDFSGNIIEGQIPESIGLLKALFSLNLSNNAFTGHIPLSISNLGELESLDLSRNKLSGTIPNGIGTLSFLEYINVSHNQLKGEIPQGTQITGQPKSSFEGNAGLCGLPLQETCFGTNNVPPTQQPKEGEEEEEVLNWKAVDIGYGLGVLLGLAIAQLVALYKPEWLLKIVGPSKRRSSMSVILECMS